MEEALLEYVRERRKSGVSLNGNVVKRKAVSLYQTHYHDGEFRASKGWYWKFLKRNKLVQRRVTGVGQKIPSCAPELCEQFLNDMNRLSQEYDVILNCDETPLYFDIPSTKTIDFEGVARVHVKTTGHEKLRYTVLLTAGVQRTKKATKTTPAEYRAFRLPPLVIFKNIKKAPKGKFPPGMVVLGTKGGSTTEQIMSEEYIPKVLVKRPGGFFKSLSTLLIMDSATSHTTNLVKEGLAENKIDEKIIHGGLTPLIQYLDTHVNKSFKGNVRESWEDWMANGEAEFSKTGKRRRASYEMITGWVAEAWKKVQDVQILKGFQENGYINYQHDREVLHAQLKDTLKNGRVSEELVQEVNDFLEEFSIIDNECGEMIIETDSETDDIDDDDVTDEENNEDDVTDEENNDDNVTDEENNDDDVTDEENDDDDSDVDVEGIHPDAKMPAEDCEDMLFDAVESSADEASDADTEMGNESDADTEGEEICISDTEEGNGEDETMVWVNKGGYVLGEVDRIILVENKWLNTDIMDAAQFLVSSKLGSIHQSVMYCRKPDKFTPVDWDNLQFVHNGRDHWILTRSTNGQVQIFDSLRKSKLDFITQQSIRCVYALHKGSDGMIAADLMNVQRQTDNFNCGVFAVAYAADILFGINPVMSTYDVSSLRAHLIMCLEEELLTPFPKVSADTTRQRKLVESIDMIYI